MSLAAFAAAKAAPGVTTSAVAVAAVWPAGRRVLLAECDPGGGDLAARFGLPAQPGLVSLAAAARREIDAALMAVHAQALPGGLRVLSGPPGADQAVAALGMLAPAVVSSLDDLQGMDVVADLGRLDPASPALPLARAASLLVLVVRPRLDELQHLAYRVAALREQCRNLGLVMVGAGPYPAEEIAAALGVEVLGSLPADQRGAGLLGGEALSTAGLRRAPLVRAARQLTATIVGRLAPASAGGPQPAPVAGTAAPELAAPRTRTAPEARR
jgi:MinD-like ATPase involved in chromosome partitioning or flagellar assembly